MADDEVVVPNRTRHPAVTNPMSTEADSSLKTYVFTTGVYLCRYDSSPAFDWTEDDGLDSGETAALAVAEKHDAVLLTDDLAAREAATEAGIEVHGSVGVIALGHAYGLLDCDGAATLMRALQRETSLFVTDAVIERGIGMLYDQ